MEELAVGTRVEHPRYSEGIVSKNKITRIYGSLTSFNLLFAENKHYFVGAKS